MAVCEQCSGVREQCSCSELSSAFGERSVRRHIGSIVRVRGLDGVIVLEATLAYGQGLF